LLTRTELVGIFLFVAQERAFWRQAMNTVNAELLATCKALVALMDDEDRQQTEDDALWAVVEQARTAVASVRE
jgi:hypothetical protein